MKVGHIIQLKALLYKQKFEITTSIFEMNGKPSFKWPFVQKMCCSIHNSTFETLIWSKMCLILIIIHYQQLEMRLSHNCRESIQIKHG